MLDGPNRVSTAIDRTRIKIDALDAEQCKSLDESMAIAFDEHFAYQELQSQTFAAGKLTFEEAQIIYVALGEVGSESNGGWDESADLATKVVVTQIMGELLTAKVKARGLR